MNFAKYYNYSFKNTFLQDYSRQLLLIFRKLDIQTFNSKLFFSLDQYYYHAIFDHDLMSRNNDPQNFKNRSNS